MYARLLKNPTRSAFLFGPRGTRKSTWIQQRFPEAPLYNLLDSGEALRLAAEPQALYRELADRPSGSWAVLDEVQKAPALFNEVHRLIEEKGLRFILSGSSARKLRRGGVNLLAGRAITTNLFPLTSAELSSDFNIEHVLRFGTLPLVIDTETAQDYLRSYVETYLMQEVQAEALTRNVGTFARFLEVAARQNAQTTNATRIARDTGVHRRTVESHFEILVDTLLGHWLPAWRLKSSNRQLQRSKFYFFDCGVARALTRRLPYPPTNEELGPQIETLILNELRAYLAYSKLGYLPHYWRSYDGAEVDILLETARGFVAIEVKAAWRWEKRFNRSLRRVAEDLGRSKTACFGVYTGEGAALWDDVRVLPLADFLQRVWEGEVFA